MGYRDKEGAGVSYPFVEEPSRSGFGVLSIALAIGAILFGYLVFSIVLPVISASYRISGPNFYASDMFRALTFGHRALVVCLYLGGIGCAIAGLAQSDRRKDLPVVGLILNGVLLLGLALTMARPVLETVFRNMPNLF